MPRRARRGRAPLCEGGRGSHPLRWRAWGTQPGLAGGGTSSLPAPRACPWRGLSGPTFGYRLMPRACHGCVRVRPHLRPVETTGSPVEGVVCCPPRVRRHPLPPPASAWVVGPQAPCPHLGVGLTHPHTAGSWSIPGLLPSSFLSRLNHRCWGMNPFPRVRHGSWPEKPQPTSVPVDETPRVQMAWTGVPALCSAEA